MAGVREKGTVFLASGNARITPNGGGAPLSFNNTARFVQNDPVFFDRDPDHLGWAINVTSAAIALSLAKLALPATGATRAAKAALVAHVSGMSVAWPQAVVDAPPSADAEAELRAIRSKIETLNARVGVVAMRELLAGARPLAR